MAQNNQILGTSKIAKAYINTQTDNILFVNNTLLQETEGKFVEFTLPSLPRKPFSTTDRLSCMTTLSNQRGIWRKKALTDTP